MSETSLSSSTQGWDLGLALIQWTRMERPYMDKHSSLLQTFVNSERKSFTALLPGPNVKFFLAVIYIFCITFAIESVTNKLFHPSLMVVGKAMSLFKS